MRAVKCARNARCSARFGSAQTPGSLGSTRRLRRRGSYRSRRRRWAAAAASPPRTAWTCPRKTSKKARSAWAGASVCAACARKTTRRASRIPGTRPWGAAVAPKAARGRGTDASARRRNFVPRASRSPLCLHPSRPVVAARTRRPRAFQTERTPPYPRWLRRRRARSRRPRNRRTPSPASASRRRRFPAPAPRLRAPRRPRDATSAPCHVPCHALHPRRSPPPPVPRSRTDPCGRCRTALCAAASAAPAGTSS